MSEGQFIFKPDSFVLKYEIMLSLWHVESQYWKYKWTTQVIKPLLNGQASHYYFSVYFARLN